MKNFKRILATVLTFIMLLQTVVGAVSVGDFSDMPFGKWSEEAVTAAIENGLLKGYDDGTIKPDDNLSRAELAAIVTRAFGAKVEADISAVKDVTPDKWFYSEVAKAYKMGAVQGTSDITYSPESDITREAAFVILARVLCIKDTDATVLDKFKDRSEISDWALESIIGLAKLGYVNGYNDSTLQPKGNITRAELAQLFHNIFKTYIGTSGVVSNVVVPGSVIVRTPGVELKGVTIQGDLIIADGVGNGNFELTDVTVNGRIIARGGEGKITFKNVTVSGGVIVNDPNGIVNFNNYRSEAPFKNLTELTKATFLDDLTFTLTFETNGGSKIEPVQAKGGTVISLDKYTPKKSGYKFKGWYTEKEFKTLVKSIKLASNMTVYAKWDALGGGGGGGGGGATYHDVTIAGQTTQVKDGDSLSQAWLDEMAARTDLQITGFYISGWEKENGTAFDRITDKIKADIELFPVYMPLDTTVVFWKNQNNIVDGYSAADINGNIHDIRCNVTTGSSVTVPATAPAAPAGYSFAGWALKADTTETIVSFPYIKPATSLEFVPVFKKNGTVIFYKDAEGTTPFETLSDVAYNSDVNAPATNPTLDGHTFAGWALKGDTTAALVTFPVKMLSESLEFVPVFTINKGTVIFYEDAEGTIPFETLTDVAYDTDVNAPATNPEINGYTFKGWALKGDATAALVTFPVKMPDGSLEFVPVFEVTTFTVTFYNDDNTTIKHAIDSVPYGTTVDAAAIPETGLADEIGFDRTAYDTIFGSNFIEDQGLEEVHKIPYTWWYNNGTKWVEFDSTIAVTSDIDVYINSGYANLVINVDKFGSLGLTLETLYNRNIRLIDTLKDALFINTGIVNTTYNNVLKDKILDQMIDKGIIDSVTNEILNQHRFIKLVDVLGKDRIKKMIDDAVADYITEDEDISQKLENYLKSIDDTNKEDTKKIISDAIAEVVSDKSTAETLNAFVEAKLDEMIDIIFPGGIPGFTYDPDSNSFEMNQTGIPGFEYDSTIPGFRYKVGGIPGFEHVDGTNTFKLASELGGISYDWKIPGFELEKDMIPGFEYKNDGGEKRFELKDNFFGDLITYSDTNGGEFKITIDDSITGFEFDQDEGRIVLSNPDIEVGGVSVLTLNNSLPGFTLTLPDTIQYTSADYTLPGLKLDLPTNIEGTTPIYDIPSDVTNGEYLPGLKLSFDKIISDLNFDGLEADYSLPGLKLSFESVISDLNIDGLEADYSLPGLKLDLNTLKNSLGSVYLVADSTLPGFKLHIDAIKAELDIENIYANSTVPGVDVVLPAVSAEGVTIDTEYADDWFGYTFELPDANINIPNVSVGFEKNYDLYYKPAYIPDTDLGSEAASHAPEGFTWNGSAYVLNDIPELEDFDYEGKADRAIFKVRIPGELTYEQGSNNAILKVNASIPSGIDYADGIFTINAPTGTTYDGVDTFVVNTIQGVTYTDKGTYGLYQIDPIDGVRYINKDTYGLFVIDAPNGCVYDKDNKAFVIDTQALEDYGFVYEQINDNSGVFKMTDIGFGAPVLEFDDGSVSGKPGYIIDKDAVLGFEYVSAIPGFRFKEEIPGFEFDSANCAFIVDTDALPGFVFEEVGDHLYFKIEDTALMGFKFNPGSDTQNYATFTVLPQGDPNALPGMKFVAEAGNGCWFEIDQDSNSYLIYSDNNGIPTFTVVVDLANTELVNLVVDKLIDYVAQDDTDISLFLELINEIIGNLDSDQRADLLEKMFPGDTSVKQQYQMVDEFTAQLCNDDEFIVKKKNLFIFTPMLKKLEDYTFEKLIEGRLNSKLLEMLPIDIVKTIYDRAFNGFIDSINSAVEAAELDADDSTNTYPVATGLMIDINPVSDIIIPGLEYSMNVKSFAEGKLKDKLDTYYKYYDENPFKDAIEYYLDPADPVWFEGTDKGYMGDLSGYKLLDFSDYYDLYKSFMVVADDAISWYYDEGNVAAEDRETVYEILGTRVIYIANMLNKYLVEYSVNGIPMSISDLIEDLEEDPAMLAYLQNYGLDAYLNQIDSNAATKSIYDILLNRFGDRLDTLLDRYSVTPFNRVYDDGEYEKAKEMLDKFFGTDTIDVFSLDSLFEDYFEDVDSWSYAKEGFELELKKMLFFII